MKNLFGFLAMLLVLIPACDQDATEEVFNPTDNVFASESIYAPLLSYKIDPAAFADNNSRRGDAVERPIKFKAEGILYPVEESTECPEQYEMVIEGGGNGSHVGNFTIHLHYCFIMVSGEAQLTSYVTGKCLAANGDEFYVVLVDAGEDPHYQTYMITGGSGRFTGASGSYTLYGYVDFEAGQWMHEGGGTIIY